MSRAPESPHGPLLPILYREIEDRCRETAESLPPWPCRRGCDDCCRRLAEPPRLVREEWRRIEIGLQGLAPEVRSEIEDRLVATAELDTGPVVCPFLELESGACGIYDHRPSTCRTYGFYQLRDGAAYCRIVEEHADRDTEASPWASKIVWGRQESIDHRLKQAYGAPIPLRQWLRERRDSTTGQQPGTS